MITPVQAGGIAANPLVGGHLAALSSIGGKKKSQHDNVADMVNQRQNYINSLSPGDLLKMYSGYATQLSPGLGIGDYLKQKQGVSTQADEANFAAYQSSKNILGRDPTAQEFAQIIPAFQGPNGVMNGNAFVSNLAQQYKLNPTLNPGSPQNNQNPADINSSVAQQFKSVLGRDATPDELAHFSQAIQSGQTDAYGLSGFLKTMPEYTNKQDASFRQGLNSELQNYDVSEFDREKQGILSQYAQNGMGGGASPSLDYALTDLMGRIAQNRSSYLAQLSASQYGGNKDLAVGNYQNTLNNMYSNNQQNRQQASGYGQQLLNQGFAGADYQTQMNDLMKYMGQNRGQSLNPLYGAIGGTIGAIGGGLATHSAAGAGAGYQIGSGIGNAYSQYER